MRPARLIASVTGAMAAVFGEAMCGGSGTDITPPNVPLVVTLGSATIQP